MKIFVTGAEGFIGSHLVESLIKKKYHVTALVLYNFQNSSGWLSNIEKKNNKYLKIIYGDVRDFNYLLKKTKSFDVIFHLAALISIPYSYHSPKSYLETNLMGTYNILESAKLNKTKKIIITSTSEVYGTAKYIPMDEYHELQPQSPYSASKISADNLALSYFNSFDLPVTIIRPFNTFGPRQSTRAIIPSLMTQINFGKSKLNVGNLKPSRDFTFIKDTVDAFIKTLNSKKIEGETINICNNFDISILDLLNIIKRELKLDFTIKIQKERLRPNKSEVFRLQGSNKKAKKLLKWKPAYSGKKGFAKAIRETYNWYGEIGNLKYFKDIYNI